MNDSNDNGGVPTLIDRAIYQLDRQNEKNRFLYRLSFYNLMNVEDSL